MKYILFKIISYRVKNYLPVIGSKFYKKLFTLSYKIFVYLRPSQIWVIILALLNKTELKTLLSIPSIFLLFSSLFSDPNSPALNVKTLQAKLETNKFTDKENNWEVFF
jgi:hypothetical protein